MQAVRRGRTAARQASRQHRYRRGGAGLLRAFPETLRRRLGPPLAQCHAGGQGASVPRGGGDSRARVLERARPCARRTSGVLRRRSRPSAASTGWRSRVSSCARREQDFGGCRCQAFLITGDARAADPVCHLSPQHGRDRTTGRGARRRRPTATATQLITANLPNSPDCNAEGSKCWRLALEGGALRGAVLEVGPRRVKRLRIREDFDDSACHGSAFSILLAGTIAGTIDSPSPAFAQQPPSLRPLHPPPRRLPRPLRRLCRPARR